MVCAMVMTRDDLTLFERMVFLCLIDFNTPVSVSMFFESLDRVEQVSCIHVTQHDNMTIFL